MSDKFSEETDFMMSEDILIDTDGPPSGDILQYFDEMITKADLDRTLSENTTSSLTEKHINSNYLGMAQSIRQYINKEFNNLPENLQKILYIAKYIVEDATISGFQLMSGDRLQIFLLLSGENWRSHKCKAFQYVEGCWQEEDKLKMPALDLLTATEGLFILSGSANARDLNVGMQFSHSPQEKTSPGNF